MITFMNTDLPIQHMYKLPVEYGELTFFKAYLSTVNFCNNISFDSIYIKMFLSAFLLQRLS